MFMLSITLKSNGMPQTTDGTVKENKVSLRRFNVKKYDMPIIGKKTNVPHAKILKKAVAFILA